KHGGCFLESHFVFLGIGIGLILVPLNLKAHGASHPGKGQLAGPFYACLAAPATKPFFPRPLPAAPSTINNDRQPGRNRGRNRGIKPWKLSPPSNKSARCSPATGSARPSPSPPSSAWPTCSRTAPGLPPTWPRLARPGPGPSTACCGLSAVSAFLPKKITNVSP